LELPQCGGGNLADDYRRKWIVETDRAHGHRGIVNSTWSAARAINASEAKGLITATRKEKMCSGIGKASTAMEAAIDRLADGGLMGMRKLETDGS
jgi:hypothetical protein